ncbi:hypothetical protein HY031_02080 [Candidatus Gottesmanbacteria bacterium]|nr:hypothetical protein [Candidatus Gottesmanbacteria bacterium]
MRKIFLIRTFFFVLIVFLITTIPVAAAKPRIRRGSSAGTPGITYSSARISRSTHSVVVTFTNLGLVKNNAYTLSYVANGIQQGVVGTMIPSGQTDSRDLYVGTCSKGVCTPHYNIQGMTLLIETTLTSGGVYTKRYRIKF